MFLKNKNIIFKIRRSKLTDYAALKYSKHKVNILSIAPTTAKPYRIPAISAQHLVKSISNGNLYLDNLQVRDRILESVPSNYAKQVDNITSQDITYFPQ